MVCLVGLRSSRSTWAVLTGLALGVSALTVPSAADATTPPEQSSPVLRSPATVTLLTGDRVTLRPGKDGKPQVDVQSYDGGPAKGYAVRNDHGRISVIPHEVAALVPGVLDPALFDVSGLIEMGYDDAHRADLPVIVRGTAGARTMTSGGYAPTRTLATIGATAGLIQKSKTTTFAAALTADRAAAPAKIWLDAALHGDSTANAAQATGSPTAKPTPKSSPTAKPALRGAAEAAPLDGYLDQVKAPSAWRRGLDGQGVKVAILDSGIDTGHPALENKVTATQDFTGEGPQDDFGRGTQIASLVAGNGAGSDGARKGIAPGAELISGKILNAAGEGTVSGLIAAMEWAVDQHADLINVSLGARAPYQGDDLLADAVDRLTEQSGALFVVAAGDSGDLIYAKPGFVETPGTAASALTVGAVDDAGNRARYTSMGPTHSWRQKPEVAAPGNGILGARAGARDGDLYAMDFGTSRSTPMVTGAAALLLQQHPELTWQQLKARLSSSAVDSNGIFTGWYGSGRVNLDVATSPTGLVPNVGVMDFGAIRHPDNSPQKRTLTLTNPGTEPVTLTFADQEVTIWNKPAPESTVTVSPAQLTVPAGGTADATVTFDPAGLSDIVGEWTGLDDNIWEGALDVVDTAGKRRLRLALNAYDEPPMYDASVRVLDRNGKPVSGGYVNVFNSTDGHFNQFFLDDQGRGTARITPGVQMAYGFVPTGETMTFAIESNITVDRNTSFTLDARQAVQVKAPVVEGQPTAVVEGTIGFTRGKDAQNWQADELPVTAEDLAAGRVYVTPTAAPQGGFAEAVTRWQLKSIRKTHHDTPDLYQVYQTANRFTAPLVKTVDRKAVRDMARIETSFGTAWGGGERRVVRGVESTFSGMSWKSERTVVAPSREVELVSAGPGIAWWQCEKAPASGDAGLCDNPTRTYRPGEKVRSALGTALHPQILSHDMWNSAFTLQVGMGDANHEGVADGGIVGGQRLALYRNGELVGDVPDVGNVFEVPGGPARWRVEHSWETKAVPTSGVARTAWEFDATVPPGRDENPVHPPMIRPAYDPYVSIDGSTPAGRSMPFDLTLSYPDGAAVPVKSAKVWVSADRGKHWSQAPLVRTADGYRTIVAPWQLLPGKTLSVRTAVTDRSGGSVDQTVLDLVPVR